MEKYDSLLKLNVEEPIIVYSKMIHDVAKYSLLSTLKLNKTDLRASIKDDLTLPIFFSEPLYKKPDFWLCFILISFILNKICLNDNLIY